MFFRAFKPCHAVSASRPVLRALAVAAALSLCAATARAGQPFIWDDDQDGMDDRMETVQLLGYRFAFEAGDTLQRQRIEVQQSGAGIVFSVYVVYKNPPTASDFLSLTLLGMPVLHRFEALPAVRSVATFAQAQAASQLPEVERIEAIPLLYPLTREEAASAGVRDPSGEVDPTWQGSGGLAGEGVVVAFLDTGINDGPDGSYAGHESVRGRCVGGAVYTNGDSALDTPRDGTVNPADHGGAATSNHGTHVAGIAIGTGGESGYAAGMAPLARFVDVKVIGDAGFGTAVAEAIDWCIHNRTRDWGAGPELQGIDVINLSVSSLDASDGNDVAARLAARAAELGIAVVASMGNDGRSHFVPSPASGDGVIAVGAYDAARSGRADDDAFAPFSNYGPRAGDGDADAFDEMKPDLVAPGVAVLSADGDPGGDGTSYRRLSGTSMSAALVSGAVAALRSEFPSLAPAQIVALLRATARPALLSVPAGDTGPDPRWHSPVGWGALDLYAARLELLQPQRTQVRRLVLTSENDLLSAAIWTGRERGAPFLVLERAPDLGGTPGAFAPLDSVAAAGDSSLANGGIQIYPLVRALAPEDRGVEAWYRVAYTEAGTRWTTPGRRLLHASGIERARIEVTIVHNAYDHDVDAAIEVGGSSGALWTGSAGSGSASLTIPLPGSASSVSSDWVSGTSATGNIAWTFSIPVPAGEADAWLPPGPAAPWTLRVTEGGYLNRGGRITNFRLIWHASGGDVIYDGQPTPQVTLEGSTTRVYAPSPVTAVEGAPSAPRFRAEPNPARAGSQIAFRIPGALRGPLRVFDVSGREVARVMVVADGDHGMARWSALDATGLPLPAGLYFGRVAGLTSRVTLIGR